MNRLLIVIIVIIVISGFVVILAAAVWLLTGGGEIIIWPQGTDTEIMISRTGLWLLLAESALLWWVGFSLTRLTSPLPDPSNPSHTLIEGFQRLPPRPEYLTISEEILHAAGYSQVELQELMGGYDASGVFVVRGDDHQGRRLRDRVLKLGNYKDISAERKNHKIHVNDYLANSAGQLVGFSAYNGETDGQTPAGALYEFARMGQDSQVQNLQDVYHSASAYRFQAAEAVHKSLDVLLNGWYQNGKSDVVNPYRDYPRLLEKLNAITIAVTDLIGDEKRRSKRIELKGRQLHNPIAFIKGLFKERYDDNRFNHRQRIYRSIIHGDLHSRNILVENPRKSDPAIWFIDFSNTQEGPTLRDFGSLEADIKFCLLKKDEPESAWDEQTWKIILETEERFSPRRDAGAVFAPNDEELAFLSDYPDVYKAWKCVAEVRKLAQQFTRTSGHSDRSDYALPLFHATLPIVYYQQCTKQQKEYALISAAWLCDTLQ